MFQVPKHDACPFCEYLAGTRPCAFVFRDEVVSAFMNRTQYERGALLIVPNEHRETILDVEPEVLARIYRQAQRVAAAMVQAFGVVGVNVFHNSGVRAGQTVPHMHVHVVPRYESSKPSRRFNEQDFDHTPLEDLEKIAGQLRNVLIGRCS